MRPLKSKKKLSKPSVLLAYLGLINWRMRLFLTCLLLSGVFSVFGQNLKAFLDKGDRFFGRGDFKSALQNYESAERVAPTDARVKYRIGHVYLSLGNRSEERR